MLLTVLVLWATQDLHAKKKPPAHPLNLNAATAAELQQVPGIGPAIAEKILQARKSYGAFKSVDDLQAIKGIGPKKLDKMRKYLTLGTQVQNKSSAKPPAVAAKSPPAKNPPTKPVPAPKSPPPLATDDQER